jgi:hypothetical protein
MAKTAENRLKATLKPKNIINANIAKFHTNIKIIFYHLLLKRQTQIRLNGSNYSKTQHKQILF